MFIKSSQFIRKGKNYVFIGCNSTGNNAYFIRKDKIDLIKPSTVEEGYVESRFRESRDIEGKLPYITGIARLKTIREMSVFDVEKNVISGFVEENE